MHSLEEARREKKNIRTGRGSGVCGQGVESARAGGEMPLVDRKRRETSRDGRGVHFGMEPTCEHDERQGDKV